jgi:hypothetical protein
MNTAKTYSLVILLSLIACSSCRTKQAAVIEPLPGTKAMILNREFIPTDQPVFSILSAEIEGDVMSISVNYPGGKGFHDFDLVFNGIMMKSMPPQVNLFVRHSQTEDNCDRIMSDSLKFDIRGLRLGEHGSVIIRLEGYSERLEYLY